MSWYAMKVTTDAEKWEVFHDIAGGIMFLPWLFIFLFIVIFVETRRAKKSEVCLLKVKILDKKIDYFLPS